MATTKAEAAAAAADRAENALSTLEDAAAAAYEAAERADAAAGDIVWAWVTEGNTKTLAISYLEEE